MTQNTLLGDLIDIKHGYAFKGEFFTGEPSNNILVTPGNFEIGGGFKQNKPKYYNGPIDEHYILAPNSIVITMTDLSKEADTLGYTARVPGDKVYLHNQRVGLIKLKSDKADLDYIYWLMRSNDYRRWVVTGATGSTVKHTAPSKILNYKFELPDLATQQKIAHILGTIEEKIELNKKLNKTLEELGQALFRQAFIGNAEAEKWRTGTIADFGKVVTGKTPPTKQTELFGGEYLFLKIPDMTQTFPLSTTLTLTQLGYDKQKPYLLPANSLNVSCIGTVGLITVNRMELSTNQNINSVIPSNPDSLYYMYFSLKPGIKLVLDSLGAGSVFSTVSKSKFEKIAIKIPDNMTLKLFSHSVVPVMEHIYNNTLEIEALTNLRDNLIPKLFSNSSNIHGTN